jgi:glycerophosphoryl diester phosphodiesterase
MKPLIFGHRGASAYAPENTLAAFALAFDLGADGVELDVSVTRDGVPVVLHDDTVDRTTNGRGTVKDMTLEELKRLDAGERFRPKYRGERIPTLEEVLAEVGQRGIVNIELKSGRLAVVGLETVAVANVIRKARAQDRVIISSFNHFALHRIKALDARLTLGLLYFNRVPLGFPRTLGRPFAQPAALHPRFTVVTGEFVKWAKSKGYKLNTWTVDDPAEARRLADLGVDSIMTNCPDVLKQALA